MQGLYLKKFQGVFGGWGCVSYGNGNGKGLIVQRQLSANSDGLGSYYNVTPPVIYYCQPEKFKLAVVKYRELKQNTHGRMETFLPEKVTKQSLAPKLMKGDCNKHEEADIP